MRVRVGLNLKGLEAEQVNVDLLAGQQRSPDFQALNPQMVVPALIVGEGPPLVQSLAILEYLDECHPEPPLLPASPRARARVRALAQIVACDTHPLIVPRVRECLARCHAADEARRTGWCRHWIAEGLRALEAHLSRDRETGVYCHGDAVTIADICLVSLTAGQELFGGNLDSYPTVARISGQCMANDAFARAHPFRQPGAPLGA
jgi:maleylacetoacetate isomerase